VSNVKWKKIKIEIVLGGKTRKIVTTSTQEA